MNNSTVLANRYEVMALVQAVMCNQNGNPDENNAPRQDIETGKGIITDVAFKSRMRKYWETAYANKTGFNVLITDGASINRAIAEAVIETKNEDSKKQTIDATKFMCNKYIDVRAFGGVLTTGLNAGQVQGVAQVSMSLSVDEITPQNITITRKAYTDGKFDNLAEYDNADKTLDESKKRTMGEKAYAPYGLYVFKMSVSANLAEKVGFTEDDLKALLESVIMMYNDATSSKMGMTVLTPIIVFKHVGTSANEENRARECKLGCASAFDLFNLLSIKKKDTVEVPRDITDYDVVLRASNMPAGVNCGIKKSAFADIEWLDNVDINPFEKYI